MMQFEREENSNRSGETGEMAEARVGELAPVVEDKNDKLEVNNKRASHEGEDSRNAISSYLYRDDSVDTEANIRSAQDNPTEAACKNSLELPCGSVSHESTPIEDEIRAEKHLTTGDDCHSIKNSQDGEENKENCCVAVAPALVLTGSSAAPEEEGERLKRSDPKTGADGCVAVVFPGSITQDACCKFVCEILKCVLYLRQQLPMTYDQLVYFQKKQQATGPGEEVVGGRPGRPGGWDVRRCQRTVADLEEVLQQLEVLFSLSRVPRVLLLLGGTSLLPKEAYEVNLEALWDGPPVGRGLRTSACLRQLFRRLFLADFLLDARPVRLLGTVVMAMAHRDCGVGWFRPRLDYRVPPRAKRRVIALSCAPGPQAPGPQAPPVPPGHADDYVWFQAPVTIKGFCK
ncbi:hypothetical protein COCON_G00227470 [Conger conger]|uniref:MAD2L1-binding protein n=1 Tax=Conger conger TaxID=82655 RepID=A0A9Q1CWU4_CONCO|nr:hypothetical protein COCON_G00227470 [Conger conger]